MAKNKTIQKLKSIWAIEDLRTRILNTILFLLVYVAGTQILLPGIDSKYYLVPLLKVVGQI